MKELNRKLVNRMVDKTSSNGGGGNSYVPQSQAVSWTDIDGKPTTLAGYGITDAYWATTQSTSDKRNLTIGSVTQQVITAHQSLSGYATEYWVGQQGYATQYWVGQQGYLTSSALSGYATQQWVGNNYLSLSGGTLTGTLKVKTGYGISDATDNGLLCYHPVDWAGVSSSQWGVGAIDSVGVIRSSADALKHYRCNDGTYDIIDAKGGQTIANNLQVASVKIEETNEINSYTGMLHLNYRVNTNMSLCNGGGNVGIGTVSPSYKLHVSGQIYCTGGFTFLSDSRKKNIIDHNVQLSVDDIANAPLIHYTLKDDPEKRVRVGSIAQYWKRVLPESVNHAEDGTLSMNYDLQAHASVIVLARKVRELERIIYNLQSRIA